MNGHSCQSPLSWETLIGYWLGELDPADEASAEEHYLGCAQCSHRLEQLAALARGVRDLARRSGVPMIVNDQFVRRLSEDGLHVREYRVPRNGSVNCTVAPEDDFVVGRLEAPLAGVQRVDMVTLDSNGNVEVRQPDIPFVAASGGVVVAPSIDMLRGLSTATLRLRLLAVDADGEHTLGDYTFNHTPYASESPQ
ncbi:MAG: hypothetical protein P8090_14270 [Gammaproteobacteria bacterium]